MIELFTADTPNGWKISIMLEEIRLDYKISKIDLNKGEQHNPEFKKIGWCVSDSIYVIIMSEEELSELKGIRIDTREKSQSKSKTNS